MEPSVRFQLLRPFVSDFVLPGERLSPAWWFVLKGPELLVRNGGDGVCVPQVRDSAELGIPTRSTHYLGRYDGCHCYAAGLADDALVPQGLALEGLRSLFGRIEQDLWILAGRASQILVWDHGSRFCGCCGAQMTAVRTERAKECPECGWRSYPRISPAVIVLVRRGNQILMVRAHRHPTGMYSNVAGFVEPGETLEEAVRREVREEAGIEIRNLRFFGSQPWPFPDSLMIAFTAEYASGELRIEPAEIADAGWFTADRLPMLPGKLSVSRGMIDWFLSGCKPDP